jgi:hypothetical protein
MIPAGSGPRIQARYDERIATVGTPFAIVGQTGTYRALADALSQNDMPPLVQEHEDANAAEMQPVALYAVERSCPLRIGDFVVWPASADPDRERYFVESVQDFWHEGVLVRKQAILLYRPNLRRAAS